MARSGRLHQWADNPMVMPPTVSKSRQCFNQQVSLPPIELKHFERQYELSHFIFFAFSELPVGLEGSQAYTR